MSGIFLLLCCVLLALYFIDTRAQDTGTACNSLSCDRLTQENVGREFQVLQETLAKENQMLREEMTSLQQSMTSLLQTYDDLREDVTYLRAPQFSTYVRWVRTTCAGTC